MTQKKLNENLRNVYLQKAKVFFESQGEEVLTTGTNEFALPCVDEENNEKFIQIIVKVPTGSRDGDLYDGYSMAEDFTIKQKDKAEKAEKAKKAKAEKIAKDKKFREQQKILKEKREKGQ